jgi:hypothetical protein
VAPQSIHQAVAAAMARQESLTSQRDGAGGE